MANVEVEIAQKEGMLTTLKHSLTQYHKLKVENDHLLAELVTLDAEKLTLAAQLEEQERLGKNASPHTQEGKNSAQVVVRLREKLKAVEARLKIQNSEQKRAAGALKLVERSKSDVKALEASIASLKRAKADMVRKQKDAAKTYAGFMEKKQAEVHKMRRANMKDKQRTNAAKNETRKLQHAFDRKARAHQKAEEALRKNKEHLTKLLALRKRERQRQKFNSSRDGGGGGSTSASRRRSVVGGKKVAAVARAGALSPAPERGDDEPRVEVWAVEDESISSAKHLLMELVAGRVEGSRRAEREAQLQAEFSAVLDEMHTEVSNLERLRALGEALEGAEVEEGDGEGDADAAAHDYACALQDQEARLEELVLKQQMVGTQLVELGDDAGSDDGSECSEMNLVAELDGPALRSILWSVLDDYTDLAVAEADAREQLARKQAAIEAAEVRVRVVTQQAAEMRRGAAERMSLMQSEKLQFAQALCSPTAQGSDQLSALRAVNADLESRLASSEASHANLTASLEALRLEQRDLSEHASLAKACRDTWAGAAGDPGGGLAEGKEAGGKDEDGRKGHDAYRSVEGTLRDLQALWADMSTETNQRADVLRHVERSTQERATEAFEDAKQRHAEMAELFEATGVRVTLLKQMLGVCVGDNEGSNTECLSLAARLSDLEAERIELEPQVVNSLEKAAEAQRWTASIVGDVVSHAEIESTKPGLLAVLQDLVGAQIPTPDCLANLVGEENQSLAALSDLHADRLQGWAASKRVLTVMVAQMQHQMRSLVATIRTQLQDMDWEDVGSLVRLCRAEPRPATSAANFNLRAPGHAGLVAQACGVLTSAKDVDVLVHSRDFVACVRAIAALVGSRHHAHTTVASTARDVMERHMEGVLASQVEPQLVERGCGDVSLAAVELLVTSIASTLRTTEQERESAYEELMGIYRDHDHAVEGHGPHTALYEADATVFRSNFAAVKSQTEARSSASEADDGGRLPSTADALASFTGDLAGLTRLSTALGVSMESASALSAELGCIGQARALCDARSTNHGTIMKLDQDLHRYFTESTAFEEHVGSDKSRLTDRSGKGRKALGQEEKTRREVSQAAAVLDSADIASPNYCLARRLAA